MTFTSLITTGYEVVLAPVKAGVVMRETGRWWIDMLKLDRELTNSLKERSFGTSIEHFELGLEIAEEEKWQNFFTSTKDYVSYRPKSKTSISVAQFEWTEVKHLEPEDHRLLLCKEINAAILRIEEQKRKPKESCHVRFHFSTEDLDNFTLMKIDYTGVLPSESERWYESGKPPFRDAVKVIYRMREQDGVRQPATALESKSEDKEKPKSESEGHSQ